MTSSLPILENKMKHLTFKEGSTHNKPDTNAYTYNATTKTNLLTGALLNNGTSKKMDILASFLVYLWIVLSVIR
jgi:hypothetical protein